MEFDKRAVTRTTYVDIRRNNSGIAVLTEHRHGGPPNERRPVACLLIAHEQAAKPRGRGDVVNMRMDAESVRDLYVGLREVLDAMAPDLRQQADAKGAT